MYTGGGNWHSCPSGTSSIPQNKTQIPTKKKNLIQFNKNLLSSNLQQTAPSQNKLISPRLRPNMCKKAKTHPT